MKREKAATAADARGSMQERLRRGQTAMRGRGAARNGSFKHESSLAPSFLSITGNRHVISQIDQSDRSSFGQEACGPTRTALRPASPILLYRAMPRRISTIGLVTARLVEPCEILRGNLLIDTNMFELLQNFVVLFSRYIYIYIIEIVYDFI